MELYKAYLRLLVAFPLVIILAYYGLRYLMQYFGPALSPGRKVQVVERTALQVRTFLYVVRVGREYLLIGSSPAGVSLIKELGEKWEEEGSFNERFSRAKEPPGFSQLLEGIKSRLRRKEGP